MRSRRDVGDNPRRPRSAAGPVILRLTGSTPSGGAAGTIAACCSVKACAPADEKITPSHVSVCPGAVNAVTVAASPPEATALPLLLVVVAGAHIAAA